MIASFRNVELLNVASATASQYTNVVYLHKGGHIRFYGRVYSITGGATVNIQLDLMRPGLGAGTFLQIAGGTSPFEFNYMLTYAPVASRIYVQLVGGTSPTYSVYVDAAIYTEV